MNDINILLLEQTKNKKLEQYGLDVKSIETFRKKIKKVTEEEAETLGKELFDTIFKSGFNDNEDKIIELIYKGANIEYKNDTKGNFALLICARKNYIKTFITLLKAGANVNQTNNYLTTSVMGSARHGNKEILELLILMGADVNARCLDGDSAIMMAKCHDNVECFDMLVNAGVYLNNRNMHNQTIADISSVADFKLSEITKDVLNKFNEVTSKDVENLLDEAISKMTSIINNSSSDLQSKTSDKDKAKRFNRIS